MMRKLDALVVGAGSVGCACALALSRRGVDVALLSDRPLSAGGQRLFALNDASRRLLVDIGVWQRLQEPIAVSEMDVRALSEKGLKIQAWRVGLAQLCHTIEEKDLLGAMHQALAESKIAIDAPAELSDLRVEADWATAAVGKRGYQVKLIVGADGPSSSVARLAGLMSPFRQLPQSAVVARLTLPRLGRTARQWMTRSGVLALLPGPRAKACVIWSLAEQRAAQVMALDDAEFIAKLTAVAGGSIKGWHSLGPRHSFPLREGIRAYGSSRVVLLGDAAHIFPPLAGQGLALGFGDVAGLVNALAYEGKIPDCGAAFAVGRYRRSRWLRGRLTHMLTTTLSRISESGQGESVLDWGLKKIPPEIAARFANLP